MSSVQRQEKAKLWEELENKDITEIINKDLRSLDFKGMDFTGKTFNNCDITRANFTNCAGLPNIVNCKINGDKVTNLMVVKTPKGAKTVYSMVRGSKPFYMIDDKEVLDLSREREAIDATRRFLV